MTADRTPLGQLYDSITAANGWSMRDVERRIAERDGKLSKSRISQLVNGWPLDSISGDAIRSLAAGLGVAPERVAIAAIQSMGFRIHVDSMTPAEAIARDESLTEDTRRALLAILRSAAERRRGA